MRFFTFLIICLICINKFSFAQEIGKPFIRNYSPQEYSAHAQNWGVVQDKRGVMYFGNGDGILEYDGVNWRVITIPNNSAVRSLVLSEEGIVYVGAKREFGYLSPDSTGTMQYRSLISHVKEDTEILEIHDTYVTKNTIYFKTAPRIFRWKNNKLTVFEAEDSFGFAFVNNDKFYVNDLRKGLKTDKEDKFSLINNGEIVSRLGSRAVTTLDNNNVLLGSTGKSGFQLLNIDYSGSGNESISITKYHHEFQDFLNENALYTSVKLSNNRVFLGSTEKGGLIIDYKKGKPLQEVSKKTGLALDIIYSSFEDKDKNLWLGLSNGIAKIETSSPISFWDKNSELYGGIEAVTKFKGIVYITTHRGVFYIKNNKVFRIPEIKNMSWTIIKFSPTDDPKDDRLLMGSRAIYEIDDGKILGKVYNSENNTTVFEMIQSKHNPKRVLIGLSNGFASMIYEDGKFKNEGQIKGLKDQGRGLAEDEDGNVWIGTFRNGAVRIDKSELPNENKKFTYYKKDKGFPSLKNILVYPFKGGVTFGTEFGLYKYDKSSDSFVPDDRLGTQFIDRSKDIFSFIEDNNGDVWVAGLFNKRSPAGVNRLNKDGSYSWYETPFKMIPEMMVLAFYVEPDGKAWIGGTEGLFLYDPAYENKKESKTPALIRDVKIGNDSTVFYGSYFNEKNGKLISATTQNEIFKPDFNYDNNSITFYYSYPSYTDSKGNKYQFKLEGYDEKWSNPTDKTYKEYTNLYEGNYTFKVKASNILNEESLIASYEFKIKPPFYRTILAYIIYVIGGGLGIYFLIRFNTERLKRENERLEKIIHERTAEIREKNAELKKLSIVASKTENAVVIMDNKGNFEWANESFERLYGLSLQEFTNKYGKNIKEASGGSNIIDAIDKCINEKTPVIYESSTTKNNGNTAWFQTTLTPIIGTDGEIEKLITIDTNIDKLKEAEREIRQQHNEIMSQRDSLEEQNVKIKFQNEQIKSSINYALTIQQAMLPMKENMDKHFDSFILNRPKDIVSGDFYWFTTVDTPEGEMTFIAVVDCTGHGVPGAFMSMISSQLLSEIVIAEQTYDPATILSRLGEKVQKVLKQKITNNRDGMDLVLCRLKPNGVATHVSFAGARNSLYYSQNNEKVQRVRGSRISIGGVKSKANKSFDQSDIKLEKGSLLYLMTDGFIDQNNNERKRFGSKTIRKVLSEITDKPLEQQHKIISSELDTYMTGTDQRDDILVIGLKIN